MLVRLIVDMPKQMKNKLIYIAFMKNTTIKGIVTDMANNYIKSYEKINGEIPNKIN